MGFLLELNYMKKRQHVSVLRTEVMYKKQWSSCPITDFTGRDFTIFILYPNTDHSAYQNIHKQLLAPGTSYVFNKCKDLKQTGEVFEWIGAMWLTLIYIPEWTNIATLFGCFFLQTDTGPQDLFANSTTLIWSMVS